MSVHLCLESVSVVRLRGWGKVADGQDEGYRVELRDVGEFVVTWRPFVREKRLLSVSIEHLRLTVGTEQVTTGGGWVGYGRGFSGALAGSLRAGVLNALTTRTHEETWLGVYVTLPNGTTRDAVFQIHDLDDSELRDRLAAAIPVWADGYVDAARAAMEREPIHSNAELGDTFERVDRMHDRGLLDDRQALVLGSEASGPFVDRLIEKFRAGGLTDRQVDEDRGLIDRLYRERRITSDQLERLEAQLAGSGTPQRRGDRVRQLTALGELREIGALTEDEFQAEKARILKLSPAP